MTKFAYHVVRLLDEVEQLLVHHDMDLRRNAEQLKSIRRGEWSLIQLEDYFKSKETDLEKVYHDSTLPDKASPDVIRQLLMDCLEQHFGTLGAVVTQQNAAELALKDIQAVLKRYDH